MIDPRLLESRLWNENVSEDFFYAQVMVFLTLGILALIIL